MLVQRLLYAQAVREQIRKLAVGGAPGKDDKNVLYQVSDSEDEELSTQDGSRYARRAQCDINALFPCAYALHDTLTWSWCCCHGVQSVQHGWLVQASGGHRCHLRGTEAQLCIQGHLRELVARGVQEAVLPKTYALDLLVMPRVTDHGFQSTVCTSAAHSCHVLHHPNFNTWLLIPCIMQPQCRWWSVCMACASQPA